MLTNLVIILFNSQIAFSQLPRVYSVNQIYFLQYLKSHLHPSRNTHFLKKRANVFKKEAEVFKLGLTLFKMEKTFGRT